MGGRDREKEWSACLFRESRSGDGARELFDPLVAPGAQLAQASVEIRVRNAVREERPAVRLCLRLRDLGLLLGGKRAPDRLVTEGLSNADIAERLGLSEKTVRNHISNLFDKLGVWTRAQAIVFARDRGFR